MRGLALPWAQDVVTLRPDGGAAWSTPGLLQPLHSRRSSRLAGGDGRAAWGALGVAPGEFVLFVPGSVVFPASFELSVNGKAAVVSRGPLNVGGLGRVWRLQVRFPRVDGGDGS